MYKTLKPKTYWNTRIVFDYKTKTLGFKEVYYTNDKIDGYTEDFILLKEIKREHLREALSKPILFEIKENLFDANNIFSNYTKIFDSIANVFDNTNNKDILKIAVSELTFEKLHADNLRATLHEVEVLLQNKTPGNLVLQVVKNGLERATIDIIIHNNAIGRGADKLLKELN
jgi:hypothetical protein